MEQYNTIEGLSVWQFNEIMRELGYYDDQLEEMGSINEMFEPLEAIERAFYGYDFNPYRDEYREQFNPNLEYFYFNGNGNLVSVREYYLYDYMEMYESDILEFVNLNGIELDGVEPSDDEIG